MIKTIHVKNVANRIIFKMDYVLKKYSIVFIIIIQMVIAINANPIIL